MITLVNSQGDVTCMATIPSEMEVEAHFLAKEDGVLAGIALAEMVFREVDPSLKVIGNTVFSVFHPSLLA